MNRKRQRRQAKQTQTKPASTPGAFYHRYRRASATPWREERPDVSRVTLHFQPAADKDGVPIYIYGYLGAQGWSGISISAGLAEQLPDAVIAESVNGEGRYFAAGAGDCLVWLWLWQSISQHCLQVDEAEWAQLSPLPAALWFGPEMVNVWHQRMRGRYPKLYAATFPAAS